MQRILHTLPLRLAILAVALCVVFGCDQDPEFQRQQINTKLSDFGPEGKKKDPKKDKKLDKSPDEVRNEALEQVSKNLDKQQKLAEEALKNGPQNEKKNQRKKNDSRAPTIAAFGSAPITELAFDPKNKHPEKSIPIESDKGSNSKFAEITGPGQDSPLVSGGTFNLNARGKKDSNNANDAKVINGRGSAELGDDVTLGRAKEEQSLFQKYFGKPKPERKVLRTGEKGAQLEIVNEYADKKKLGQVFDEKPDGTAFGARSSSDKQQLRELYNPFGTKELPARGSFTPAPAERQGSVSERIAGELQRNELKKDEELRLKKEQAGKANTTPAVLGRGTSGVKHPLTDFEPPPGAKKAAALPESKPEAAPAKAAAAPAPPTPVAVTTARSTALVAPSAAGAAALNLADNTPITADSPINTDFNPAKFTAPESTPKVGAQPNPKPVADAKKTPDSTEAVAETQRQLGSLDDYKKGLATRDIVAREAAFHRAAVEKRVDAIPALVNEIVRNGMLGVTAARVLAVIGKSDDFIARGLMTGLNTNAGSDAAGLRETCAETIGVLRIRRAVPLLIEKAKYEKSFPFRAACVAALGAIGDPAAIETLHMKLEDCGEIEFVKQSAALALARLGDPAGHDHLLRALDSPTPAYQILGMTGLAQLDDPRTPGYLVSALDSRFDEVWTTAVMLFPRIGARSAVTLLRAQLQAGNDVTRIRASLALGFLGCSDGVPLLCRAARSGSLQERAMSAELLGRLNRTDQIPLLTSMINDPNGQVRQTAAIALARLDAKDAAPVLADAARGRFKNQLIQPVRLNNNEPDPNERDNRSILSVQLGSPEEMSERMTMLSCLRILRGEKENLVLNSLPSSRDSSWPEFDRELLKQQIELIKIYKLIDVVPSAMGGAGALIQVPGGQEILYRKGEVIAGGFKIAEISTGAPTSDPQKPLPPFATLLRGDERIILYQGQAPEVENVRNGVK